MNTLNHGDRIGAITLYEYVNTIETLRGMGIVVADGLGVDTYERFPYITWLGGNMNKVTTSRILVSRSRRMVTSKVYTIDEFLNKIGDTPTKMVFNNGNGLKHNFI